jgi:hypothetical protein
VRLLDGGELSVGQILTAGNGNGLAIVEYSRKVQTVGHASQFLGQRLQLIADSDSIGCSLLPDSSWTFNGSSMPRR